MSNEIYEDTIKKMVVNVPLPVYDRLTSFSKRYKVPRSIIVRALLDNIDKLFDLPKAIVEDEQGVQRGVFFLKRKWF
jgi:hypothetical protein